MQKRLKRGAISLTGIEFILNIIAVVIAITAITAIIRLGTQSAVYGKDSHFRNELNYILFSGEGYMPDRYSLDISRFDSVRINSINDIAVRFELSDGKEFFFNKEYFEINYPLRKFEKFSYGKIDKPILLIEGSKETITTVSIEYIFRKEDVPRAIGVNS